MHKTIQDFEKTLQQTKQLQQRSPENQQTKENHQDFPKKNKNHFKIAQV